LTWTSAGSGSNVPAATTGSVAFEP
jgi:hypothetical protein